MGTLVFLPATAPGDLRFGQPQLSPAVADRWSARTLRFDRQVWYAPAVRRRVLEQIARGEGAVLGPAGVVGGVAGGADKSACAPAAWEPPVVVVGFSKSGLGAFHILLEGAGLVAGALVFDAPLCWDAQIPASWQIGSDYRDEAAWRADLPERHIGRLAGRQPGRCSLVLVGGALFTEPMARFSAGLVSAGVGHGFVDMRTHRHCWSTDWLEAGLAVLGV